MKTRDLQSLDSCGCAVREAAESSGGGARSELDENGVRRKRGRKAIGVDPAVKAGNLTRLRRIEGQVRGVQGMVEEDRYCADILTQISSIQEALRAVSRELMRNHLRHCAASAVRAGGEEAEAMYDELIDLMHKHNR